MVSLVEFQDHPIVKAIYEQYEKKAALEERRGYVGASSIGKQCKRALWYAFRWVDSDGFDGRMHRLFRTGHLEEPRMVEDLRSIGAQVWDCDPATGKQFAASAHGGHMRGHCDGVAKNIPGTDRTPHLLEFKTHSAKSFADLVKKGLKESKPTHYWQMTWYMGKMDLKKGLYMAKNKDTDELYVTFIDFEPELYSHINDKAEAVIFASKPPERIHYDSKFFVCNMCSFKDICHGTKTPAFSCRTCIHATPESDGDGRWSCAKRGDIGEERQKAGCEEHLPIPDLVNFAEPVDAGDTWIRFKRKDNDAEFIVGFLDIDLPIYTSMELSATTDHRVICNDDIEKVRKHFGATIVG